MQTFMVEIILTTIVLGSVSIAGFSVLTLKEVSKKVCNGELKQLARLDRTIKKFHKVAHARVKPE